MQSSRTDLVLWAITEILVFASSHGDKKFVYVWHNIYDDILQVTKLCYLCMVTKRDQKRVELDKVLAIKYHWWPAYCSLFDFSK